MTIRQLSYNFFLTSRPYSYAGEIARGVFFTLILIPDYTIYNVLFSSAITLLMWLYFNWQSDWIQKDPGRINPSVYLCFSPLILALVLGFIQGQFIGIAGVVFYFFTILLYPQKAKYKQMGVWGPLLRVITIFGHFGMVAACLHKMPNSNIIVILTIIAIFKGIRNLVGDIRDIRSDKWELPARFGLNTSMNVIRIAFLVTFFLTFFIQGKELLNISMLFVLICWLPLEVLALIFKKEYAHLLGYIGHRYLVIAISIYIFFLISLFGIYGGIVLLSLLLILTQPFYRILPGKNYPSLSSVFSKKYLKQKLFSSM